MSRRTRPMSRYQRDEFIVRPIRPPEGYEADPKVWPCPDGPFCTLGCVSLKEMELGKIVRIQPTLSVGRKDVSFTLSRIETSDEEEIEVGQTFFLQIEGGIVLTRDQEGVPTVRVTSATSMTVGLRRVWTVVVEYV